MKRQKTKSKNMKKRDTRKGGREGIEDDERQKERERQRQDTTKQQLVTIICH